MIIQLIIEPLLFIAFIISCLYLPGKLLLSKLKLEVSPIEDIFLPLGLGIVLFTFVSYVLSWINLEILILPIFLVVDFFAIKNKLHLPQKIAKLHFLPLGAAGIMSLIFSLRMLVTGQYGNKILINHDDPWHLALINELKVHFPPSNPAFAEMPLKGYHFFYDLFAAKISNIFYITPVSLHFHLIPLFSALMWALGVYALLFKWTKKTSAGLWAVFLTMFGGSFAFFLVLQGHPEIDLDGGLGIGTSIWSLYNPPLTMSLLIITTSLFIILNYLRDKRQAWLIPLSLCIGIITMFKVYAGMVMLGAFLILVALQLIKKNYRILFSLAAVGFLFLCTFGIFLGGSGSLIFYPLWGPERLLQSFAWYHYDNKMYVYSGYLQNHTRVIHGLIGLILTKAYGLILFILGNLGTRLLGIAALLLLVFPKKRKLPSVFSFLLLVMLLISIIIPLFFIQTGKVFEIIQMAQYYLFFASLFASVGFAVFFELKFNLILKSLLIVVILIMTVPHMQGVFLSYSQEIKLFQSVNSPYYEMRHYLSTIGKYDDTVLELPPKEIEPNYESILGWYSHTSTPAMTALANKRTYFDNEFIDFPNLDVRARIDFVINIITLTNYDSANPENHDKDALAIKLLKSKGIKYVYAAYEIPLFGHSPSVTRIYKAVDNVLYKIN